MVRVGVFLLECEGYAGAPGSACVAGVCEGRLGRKIIGQKSLGRSCCFRADEVRDLRIRMLLGGARKILPISSLMIAMVLL